MRAVGRLLSKKVVENGLTQVWANTEIAMINNSASNRLRVSDRLILGQIAILVIALPFLIAEVALLAVSFSLGTYPETSDVVVYVLWTVALLGTPALLHAVMVCPNRKGIRVGVAAAIATGLAKLLLFVVPRPWLGNVTVSALDVIVVAVTTVLAYSQRKRTADFRLAAISTIIVVLVSLVYWGLLISSDLIPEKTVLIAIYTFAAWIWQSAWFVTRDQDEKTNPANVTAWALSMGVPLLLLWVY